MTIPSIFRLLPLLGGLLLLPTLAVAANQGPPKVAVTALTYEETVKEYFSVYRAHSKSSGSGSYRSREREGASGSYSASESERYRGSSESDVFAASGTLTYIERGELHKFTADLKGEMLKSGTYRLIQGKPVANKDMETIQDIIARIKKGLYKGADYVLFGTVSGIEWRQESMPMKGTDTVSATLSLDLTADFSLINTRTYEIRAAFSAMGSGQDVRLVQPGARVHMSRPKVIQEVSRTLGEEAARQLEEQFDGMGYGSATRIEMREYHEQRETQTEGVTIYR